VGSIHVDSPNGGEQLLIGSSQLVKWTSSNVAAVNVDFALDGVNFARQVSFVSASAGAVGWVVPSPATSTAKVRVSSTTDSRVFDVSDASFSVVGTPAQVIINEILANEPGSNTAAEFVELYNAGGTTADLSNWTISDSTSLRHRFAPGTLLAPGGTVVVFGAATGIPAGLTNAVASTTGTLSLGNSADTVTLANASNTAVDSFAYTAALASTDGVSMNRSPDRSPAGFFALHTTVSNLKSSPGVSAGGAP
jgi:hypothetical protein